jgi:hypothetical protein
MLPERKAGRPGWNLERPEIDCKTAAKPNCPIILCLPPFPRKSTFARSSAPVPRARPMTHAEAVMGAPRSGDHRTIEERWTDWCFSWEFWGLC